MLQLLSPAGLWALASLALPLAIHLWRPPPQTVRLGSLRFLDNLPHRRLRNLRWRERALLAVRLALLTALALLLAGPHWRQRAPAGPQRWALLDPAAAVSGDSAARLRRLHDDGYSVHQLAPGFPPPDAAPASAPPSDLWSLLREADAALPTGSTLAFFTPGRLAALQGTRPALRHCRVEWITTFDSAGTAAQSWIESLQISASSGTPSKGRALVGTSDAASTRFADVLVPPAQGASAGPTVELSSDATRARISLPATGPWVRADRAPSTLRLVILHDPDRAEDARSVEAAARAVAAVTGQALAINVLSAGNDPARGHPPADWLFWLSARPVPASLADGTANLLSDAESPPRDAPASTEGWIIAPPGTPGAAALGEASVRLWRRVPATLPLAADTAILWTDSQGDPLLTLQRTSHGRRWQFDSRFHPDWTDLPRTIALPAFVEGLLFPPPAIPADSAHDLRLADPSQLSVSLSPAPANAPVPASLRTNGVDLHWPLWLLAAGLFAADRLLSRRAAPRPVSAPTHTAVLAR